MSKASDFMRGVRERRAQRAELIAEEQRARSAAAIASEVHTNASNRVRDLDDVIEQARNGALVAILTSDVVDVLAPEHRPGKCTDGCMGRDNGSCARCTLLRAAKSGHFDGRWTFTTEPMT